MVLNFHRNHKAGEGAIITRWSSISLYANPYLSIFSLWKLRKVILQCGFHISQSAVYGSYIGSYCSVVFMFLSVQLMEAREGHLAARCSYFSMCSIRKLCEVILQRGACSLTNLYSSNPYCSRRGRKRIRLSSVLHVIDRRAGLLMTLYIIDRHAGLLVTLYIIDRRAGFLVTLYIIDRCAELLVTLYFIDWRWGGRLPTVTDGWRTDRGKMIYLTGEVFHRRYIVTYVAPWKHLPGGVKYTRLMEQRLGFGCPLDWLEYLPGDVLYARLIEQRRFTQWPWSFSRLAWTWWRKVRATDGTAPLHAMALVIQQTGLNIVTYSTCDWWNSASPTFNRRAELSERAAFLRPSNFPDTQTEWFIH